MLHNAGNSAIERIDFICSSSLEQSKLLVINVGSSGSGGVGGGRPVKFHISVTSENFQ